MGRHTTPGAEARGQHDGLIGWGAFATLVASALVGLVAGWFEAFGVLVLGGLTTAALWFARHHGAAVLARGRHASDTPWSPSDLLELKDAPRAEPVASRPAAPSGRRASRVDDRPDGATDRTTGDRIAADRIAADRTADVRTADVVGLTADRTAEAVPEHPAGADPLGWLPGSAGEDAPVEPAPVTNRSRRRAAAAADLAPAVGTQVAPVVPVTRRARRAAAASTAEPVAEPVAEPLAAPLPAVSGPDGAIPGLARAVLPAAPFEVRGGLALPGPSRSPEAFDTLIGSSLGTDPLAGPISLDLLAAEPTVLDPALDPVWLTGPEDVPAPVSTVARDPEATPAELVPDRHDVAPAPVELVPGRHDPAPAPDERGEDRTRAAAGIDPLWARRARRPERPRRPAERAAVQRREPGPVTGRSGPAPDHEPEPYLVVLPEPDVPDVLMLPETLPGHDETAAVGARPAADGTPSWNGTGIPAARPSPGTLSLDELLVLHTRRPAARRGSADQPGATGGRPLE